MPTVPAASIHTSTLPALNRCWEKVLHLAQKESYPRGRYLVLNALPEGSFYYLEKGRLNILHGAVNGRVQNMLYMQPGSLINVADSLGRQNTDFRDGGCQFYCFTDVVLWRFEGGLLRDEHFIREHPDLIANLMASLGVKLLAMHNTLSNVGTGGALAKICRFCLNMAEAGDGATTLAPRISQTELANMLGMHRSSLLRSIQELKLRGVLVELTRDRLVIGDMERLRRLAVE